MQNGWVTVERATAKTFSVISRPSVNDNLQNIVACGGSTTFSCGLICLENDLIRWILLERCDRRICDKTMIARMAKMRLKMKVVKSTSLQPSPEPPAQDQRRQSRTGKTMKKKTEYLLVKPEVRFCRDQQSYENYVCCVNFSRKEHIIMLKAPLQF